jgi:hypothetical protein
MSRFIKKTGQIGPECVRVINVGRENLDPDNVC